MASPPLPLLLLLLLSTAAPAVRCVPFDLFVDSDDLEALMGLPARLYYVYSGLPNVNAVEHRLEVPSSVTALNLTWASPNRQMLLYRMAVHANRDSVTPELSVPPEGTMYDPRSPPPVSAFAVSMPCSPGSDGVVDVRLSLEVWDPNDEEEPHVDVQLTFKRFCADRPIGGGGGNGDDSSIVAGSGAFPPPYYEQAFFYHMIAAASSLAALAVVCCLTTSFHRDKARDLMIIKGFQNAEVNVFLKSALNSSSKFNGKSPPGSKAYKAKDLHECIAELSVQRQRVRLQSVELEGTFGRVYRGFYADVGGKDEEVFVKTVTDQASAVQISVLLHEGLSMYGLNHRNILTIQAVSVEQHVEPFLLYPYNNNKNLKKFLQNCKTAESISYTLTTREIIDMTLQIVNGMQYLHKNRHLHKDVAARNCLVNPELNIQIADNALSRDLFPGDYHCLGDNKNRPIKWMAVESLEHKKFSTASDIWSFGVLLWELLTLCQQPYADIDPFEISAYLQDGFRLTQPVNCPDELFTVMACCWALAPNERPTFSQLSVFLNEFNNQLVKFV